jgi:hypothetical protein
MNKITEKKQFWLVLDSLIALAESIFLKNGLNSTFFWMRKLKVSRYAGKEIFEELKKRYQT